MSCTQRAHFHVSVPSREDARRGNTPPCHQRQQWRHPPPRGTPDPPGLIPGWPCPPQLCQHPGSHSRPCSPPPGRWRPRAGPSRMGGSAAARSRRRCPHPAAPAEHVWCLTRSLVLGRCSQPMTARHCQSLHFGVRAFPEEVDTDGQPLPTGLCIHLGGSGHASRDTTPRGENIRRGGGGYRSDTKQRGQFSQLWGPTSARSKMKLARLEAPAC